MRMTPHHILAENSFGRIVSAFLTLIMVVQPVHVNAQTVSGLDPSPELTVSGDALIIAENDVEHGPTQPPTAQEVLLEVCQDRGYGEDCAKTLLGMMWKESNNVATAIGDGGRARGYFQIHYRLHKISLDCAYDLRCSAGWSLKYMERNGYPKYPSHAIQCHNGCGIKNGYAASVLRHARRLWQEPMTIELALAR